MKYLVKPAMLLLIAGSFTAMNGKLTPTNLTKINSKTSFDTKKELITKGITPENLATIPPETIQNILANDTKDLHFTRFIIQNINHQNFNNLKPVTIYHLIQKGGKDASDHIIRIFEEQPSLLIYVNSNNRNLLDMFLQTAGSDYALALAKLITASDRPLIKSDKQPKKPSLDKIPLDVIVLLINGHIEAAQHIAKLINKDNLLKTNPEVVVALIKKDKDIANHIMTLINTGNYGEIDSTIKIALKEEIYDKWKQHQSEINTALIKAKEEDKTKKKSEAPKRKLTVLDHAKNLFNGSNGKK